MPQINAYLGFGGKCREAMTFYKECLGGELTMNPIAGSPMEEHYPESERQQLMHSQLDGDGFTIMGTDMVGPEGLKEGNSMSLMLNCTSEEQIRSLYAALSEGGQATHPPHDTFWGATFGHLTDKYGKSWMLNYQKAPAP